MEDTEKLLKTVMAELERMLNTRTVVGEPITIEGNTLIPLVSVGFGFGAGGATGKMKTGETGEGVGAGTGGGGGVKPIALIVINKDGVRLEPIKGAATSVLEKVAERVGRKPVARSAGCSAWCGCVWKSPGRGPKRDRARLDDAVASAAALAA